MKKLLITLSCVWCIGAFAQKDTVVVTDYTLVMVGTDEDGEVYPVTSLEGTDQAGFFINEKPQGQVRICLPDKLFIWVNGRLLDVIDECTYYNPEQLFETAKSDTIYVSFSSSHSLSELTCELVIFEDLVVIKDQVSEPRNVRSPFSEFTIIAILILVLFLGVIVASYPARISYIIQRSFTLKVSAYEFVNTGFFSGPGMYVLAFYSLSLGFAGLYLDGLLRMDLFGLSSTTSSFLWVWLQISFGVFLLFVLKWFVISLVSALFKFRGLKNFQLFDFLNFNLLSLIPMLLFLILDFVLNPASGTWVSSSFIIWFPMVLILFVAWFTFKFVNNSPRRKLMIISYLCATEIIPVILLLGWFYK